MSMAMRQENYLEGVQMRATKLVSGLRKELQGETYRIEIANFEV